MRNNNVGYVGRGVAEMHDPLGVVFIGEIPLLLWSHQRKVWHLVSLGGTLREYQHLYSQSEPNHIRSER
jgi:hypothetical protein